MSILTVSSTNPKFSYVIAKNPATISESGKPFQRELRQGQLYGWFVGAGDKMFRLWFKDHPTKSSFADGVLGDFEYLDRSRYGSPYLPIMVIQTALATASKSLQEDDTADHEATAITTVKVPSVRLIEQMTMHFRDQASIEFTEVTTGYYKIMVRATTVFRTLNVLQAICVLMAMRDTESYIRLDRSGIEKYLRVLNNSNAPYYVRYLFGNRAITNRSLFNDLRDQLQGEGMTMFYGDTRQQRYDAITPHLKGKGTLVDVGCGEMFYSTRLAQRYEQVFAVDADEDIAGVNARKLVHRKIENVESLHAAVSPEWLTENEALLNGADVLATEVLEHMPRDQADTLLAALLQSPAERVVVTVPNASFNENYGIGEEFRHPDHHYEPTFEDWCDHTVTLAAEHGWDVDNVPIGDVVNDQSVTTMSVFTRQPKQVRIV